MEHWFALRRLSWAELGHPVSLGVFRSSYTPPSEVTIRLETKALAADAPKVSMPRPSRTQSKAETQVKHDVGHAAAAPKQRDQPTENKFVRACC